MSEHSSSKPSSRRSSSDRSSPEHSEHADERAPPTKAPSKAPTKTPIAMKQPTRRSSSSESGSDGSTDKDSNCEEVVGTGMRTVTTSMGEMSEIESMCPACGRNTGMTRLMLTTIPHFREVIVSSFQCEAGDCRERNVEIQFSGVYGAKRVHYELDVRGPGDMDRQIVKSEYATIRIPELELEMPPETQKGTLKTVEGLLVQTKDGLLREQTLRRALQPEVADQIDAFCEKLDQYRDGSIPFTLIIDDPSGNSHIETRAGEAATADEKHRRHELMDPRLRKVETDRSLADRVLLGVATEDEAASAAQTRVKNEDDGSPVMHRPRYDEYNTHRTRNEERGVEDGALDGGIVEMEERCSACHRPGLLRIHETDIPHFRQIVIMAFTCDFCGYKSNEVKTSGAVPEKAKRITLRVENESDLSRDILKSATASFEIPEIELEVSEGTLGGCFTTIQGLLMQVHTQLLNTRCSNFATGDSAKFDAKYSDEGKARLKGDHMSINTTSDKATGSTEAARQGRFHHFLEKLEATAQGKNFPFTVIVEDPLAAIYVQNPREHLPPPDNIDPQLTIEEHARTWEQDEELGLHQMDCN